MLSLWFRAMPSVSHRGYIMYVVLNVLWIQHLWRMVPMASYVWSHHLALNFYYFIVRLCVCYKQQKTKKYFTYKMLFLGTYPILQHSVNISSYRWHLAFSLGGHRLQLQSCCLGMKHYLECVQQLESGTANLCMNCLQACVHHSNNMNCTTLDLTPY
jgi:hypothetical protein